ncbi:MAG: PQQ-binding-like beta-propeller repeat protein [Phycisphaerales bacterium]|nr:MAG: PQQ-binding-like beta-propeller repeat protein [Phycisphaerales bacterium]
MKHARRIKSCSSMLLLAAMAQAAPAGEESAELHWPQFRGPSACGIAEGYSTPLEWNAETGENIAWKTPIPGMGHSSPVVWGQRIFVTTAISSLAEPELKVGLYGNIEPAQDESPHEWWVYCLDKNTGRMLWQQKATEGVPQTKRHPKATHANSTPATDGKHVVAFFGSEGLYCYDTEGNLTWQKDLGVLDANFYSAPSAQFGYASSPVIFENMVLVQCDVRRKPFVAAFHIESGNEIWRTRRRDVPTWSTPTVHRSDTRTQMIVNGFKEIAGYDVTTGEKLWKMQGTGDIPVPTPIVAHDLIFVTNAHGQGAPLYAIRPGAKSIITLKGEDSQNEYVAWSTQRNGAYMQTPLVYGDLLYSCTDSGVLNCYRATTGERLWRNRLGSGRTGFTASPVAADDKLYFASEDGDVYVVQTGPEFKLLATNPLAEICMATPAISEGVLFFRTHKHLVAVAGANEKSPPS